MHALENIHPLNGKEISPTIYFSSAMWLFIHCNFLPLQKCSSAVWFFICCEIFHPLQIFIRSVIFHPLWMKLYFGQNSFNSGLISLKILIIFEFRLQIWTFKVLFHLVEKKKICDKFFQRLPFLNVFKK